MLFIRYFILSSICGAWRIILKNIEIRFDKLFFVKFNQFTYQHNDKKERIN